MASTKKRPTAKKSKAKTKRRSAATRRGRVSRATKRVSRATKQVRETAMKALAGAAAGAVRAIMPPLEKAVGGQRESEGRKR